MPTYKKIPPAVKEIGAVGITKWAVFCRGLLKAALVVDKLEKAEKRGGVPIVGYLQMDGERIYYCRYGFVDDPDIYATPKTKK